MTHYQDFINQYGLEPENRLLIYFAGHGHTERFPDGREMGYIVPSDAPRPDRDKRGFFSKALDMQSFDTYAKKIQSKHALFIFDSCFSGSLFAVNRAVPVIISDKTAKPVRQFMTSGSADEEVPDKSIFRAQFIEGIGGEADADGDGYVTGSELGNYLETRIVNYSNGCQHPQYGKIRDPNLDKGDFVFECGGARVAAAPAYEPKLPTSGGMNLNDLKKEAEENKEARGQEMLAWANWQSKFQTQFDEAKDLENDPQVRASLKREVWEQIISGFAEENPYSEDDEKLRSYAEGRISALDQKIAEAERLAEEKRQAQAEARRQQAAMKAEVERKAEERRQAEVEQQAQAEARRVEAVRKAKERQQAEERRRVKAAQQAEAKRTAETRQNRYVGSNNFVTLGSTKKEVIKVMGTPKQIDASSNWWYYGVFSRIDFDENNRVVGWDESDVKLKVSIGTLDINASPVSIGSTKTEVIRAMGTPKQIDASSNWWYYGVFSRIDFDENNRVVGWDESDVKLKVKAK